MNFAERFIKEMRKIMRTLSDNFPNPSVLDEDEDTPEIEEHTKDAEYDK